MRAQRDRSRIPKVALVGYTNAGKSTLLNAITDAGVLCEDKLFATLDPTTRKAALPSGESILLTDTVGFIRKLPHNLIDAFRSTLEEAGYADYIIHVVDASSADMKVNMKTVYATLDKLGITERKIITVFNKIDKLENELKDAKYKALSSSSSLTERCRESQVLRTLRENHDSLLHISTQPPYIINIPKQGLFSRGENE
jgi:GTP-binding protein HflX